MFNWFGRKSKYILVLLFAQILVSCASKTVTLKNTTTQETGDIVVIASTDFHVSFDRAEGFMNQVQALRKKYGKKSIHLDGGDLFQGSLEGNLNKGKSMVEFYNLVGVNAAAIGNHELDYGPDVKERSAVMGNEDGLGNLKRRVKEANFKWLSSNFILNNKIKCNPATTTNCNALGQQTLFRPHQIFEIEKSNVCVIGATTPTTPRITNQKFIKGTRFEELIPVVEAEAKFLRNSNHCDFVILVAHAGLMCDSNSNCQQPGDFAEILRLLEKLHKGTLDAVVAGHTHLKAREIINGTPVIESGRYGQNIGVLHLFKKEKAIPPRFEDFINVETNAQNAQVENLLKPYREEAKEIKSREIGELADDFKHEYEEESALGNLLADSLLEAGKEKDKADFALINSGGIRNDFSKGKITYGDIFKVLPFDNSLVVTEMTGAELKSLFQISHSGSYGMSPFAGLKIERYDIPTATRTELDRDINTDGKKEPWERNLITKITDNKGNAIEDAKTYRLASIDFLVFGAERQDFVYEKIPGERKHIFMGTWVRDLFENYLKKHGKLKASDYFNSSEPRVKLLKRN